ncbi:unnamed protein product [Nezara viridula]|uniref:Uncharacterized protein n=1 Tax=Nezara viridula TaxID=85310 RepID=A0A9P0E5B4_NEZVI|nr:unnamed protein product [Nezara viridula]
MIKFCTNHNLKIIWIRPKDTANSFRLLEQQHIKSEAADRRRLQTLQKK